MNYIRIIIKDNSSDLNVNSSKIEISESLVESLLIIVIGGISTFYGPGKNYITCIDMFQKEVLLEILRNPPFVSKNEVLTKVLEGVLKMFGNFRDELFSEVLF